MSSPIYDAQTLLSEMAAVWRLVVHLCAADEAETIVQAVYMRAFDQINQVPADCREGARQWLFRITCDVLHERAPGPTRQSGPTSIPPNPGDPLDQQLQADICALPMPERMVFLLSFVERLRYGQIAVILRISFGEVVARLESARQGLRRNPGPGPRSP